MVFGDKNSDMCLFIKLSFFIWKGIRLFLRTKKKKIITEKSNLFYDEIKKGFLTIEKSNLFFYMF